jgi:hypothetical protein
MGLLSTDGLTLTRDVNEKSWNGTTYAAGLLSLAGTSRVFISARGDDLNSASNGITRTVALGAALC